MQTLELTKNILREGKKEEGQGWLYWLSSAFRSGRDYGTPESKPDAGPNLPFLVPCLRDEGPRLPKLDSDSTVPLSERELQLLEETQPAVEHDSCDNSILRDMAEGDEGPSTRA